MAEAPPVVNKGLKELKEEVTCPICHDFFDEPKILPCLHYYCKGCIENLAKRAGSNHPFNCPECRVPTTLPQNGPNQLPTAFFVNRMKEVHSKMEKAQGKVEAHCELCDYGKSVAFCRQCAQFICEECMKSHQRMRTFAGHKVVTLEELKKGGANQILGTKPPPPNCTIHDEPMKAYCFDCSRLICRDCIVIDHAGHKCEFAKKAAPQVKQELVEKLTPLKEVQESLYKASEKVQSTKSEIVAQGASVAENIEHSFQELHKILDQHKHRLLEEATKKVEEKVSHLSTQEKGLNTASAVIQSLVDFVEQNLENATDEEFMSIHKQISSRIEKEAEEHRKGAIDLNPVEEADMGVEIDVAEGLKEICRNRAKFYSLPVDPSKCTVGGPGLKNAEVSKQTYVSMHVVLHNGTPTKKPQKVTAELKSTVNGSVIRLEGVRKQENTYEIQFTPAIRGRHQLVEGVRKQENMYEIQFIPAIRGRHQLVVNVNDQPIAGSPFPVYVKIQPTQLGKPMRVFTGLDRPYGVTVNSAEEVLVTERTKIAVFHNGAERKLFSGIKTDLTGIATDKDSNIYVANYQCHCLMKLNKNGELLKTVGKRGSGQNEFNGPRGVAVVGDKVFVCDENNHRIQVITKERLEFMKTIGSRGQGDGQFNGPYDISHDELGNLYISEWGNNRITVLNNQGDFQFSFSKKDSGQLNSPSGVYVVDQFVYVVECSGHCVSVFSREGKYITMSGKGGNKEGEFTNPFGVCVDHDGFVYVCDYSNYRVQVF